MEVGNFRQLMQMEGAFARLVQAGEMKYPEQQTAT